MCRVLTVSRSGFYAWERRKPSKRALEQVSIDAAVLSVFKEHEGRLGSPRVHFERVHRGVSVGKNRLAGTMRRLQLRAKTHRRPYGSTPGSKHALPAADASTPAKRSGKRYGSTVLCKVCPAKGTTRWRSRSSGFTRPRWCITANFRMM
ncbi:MAG: IS3 family transposase [Chitinispirillales bacterium]|nr:IS3 family transposase [Chitinispirillales bacterium]